MEISTIALMFIWGACSGILMHEKGYDGLRWFFVGGLLQWGAVVLLWLFVPPKNKTHEKGEKK